MKKIIAEIQVLERKLAAERDYSKPSMAFWDVYVHLYKQSHPKASKSELAKLIKNQWEKASKEDKELSFSNPEKFRRG